MRLRSTAAPLVLILSILAAAAAVSAASPAATQAQPAPAAAPQPAATPAAPAAASGFEVTSLALPGAPPGGMFLDYLAVDRGRHQVWVPAGATGKVDVIDTRTLALHPIEGFPTTEIERRGRKFSVGPSSASVGEGYVYVGNRGDTSVCAVDQAALTRAGCATVPSSPDGVVYVASRKEVWVTAPRDQSIVVFDVAQPAAPKLAGSFKLPGDPEGYAVDDAHGLFYTNLEDKDRTLRIDAATRQVTATWMPACGEEGPRGLALDASGRFLIVACTDHVEVLDTQKDGAILSKLATGAGLDNLDYLPETRSLYAAAGRAAKLTIAHLDEQGVLRSSAEVGTETGARNAVVSAEGVAVIGNGSAGKVVVVKPKGS